MKRALIIANGHSGPLDFANFILGDFNSRPYLTIIVNEAFRWVVGFDHWVTLHPEKFDGWRDEARLLGRSLSHVKLWGPDVQNDDAFTILRGKPWPVGMERHWWDWHEGNSGSSGLFGVAVAFSLGCDRVALAGVPMDQGGHWNSPRTWADRDKFVGAWSASKPRLEGRVRSFSGWTRDFLGEPTVQWWGH